MLCKNTHENMCHEGESCIDKPIKTLWSNYKQNSKPNVQMKITITQSGLKALTKQHGLTEYWSNRITYCVQPSQYPKVFCWIYRHEGRKLKQELRCHAVLCSKEIVAKKICNELNLKLSQALLEFKKDKILRQNARLSLANCVYDNPSLPRRKLLLSTGSSNYKPPLERSKSAPKLMVIEEDQEEESTDDHIDYKKYSNYCIQQYGGTLKYSRPNHHYNKFNSLKYNRSKSTISQLNRNNSLDSILENTGMSNGNSCEKIYASCMSINQMSPDTPTAMLPEIDTVEDETIASCSSTPVDDVEEPLTMNEQLSINFNPNYDNTNSEIITTNPNPNENVKEYEIHLNPKFNLLKTSTQSNSNSAHSSHKLGKLLRNKSLDSILADSNSVNYNSNRNIHRKSWCYGDEKTLSMIDSDHHQQNTKKQASSVEKLNQSTHKFSSFEHINHLIEQSIKSLGNTQQENVKVSNERHLSDETETTMKNDKRDQLVDTSTKLQTNTLVENMEDEIMDSITTVTNSDITEIDEKQSNIVQINKLLENNEIPIDCDEFSMNTDEETNILNEYKYKKYSHHRLPSIESGFHDQIDSDSLMEMNSESDNNYESINHVQIVGSIDETDTPITCELLRSSQTTIKSLEAINEHVKVNQETFKCTQENFNINPDITSNSSDKNRIHINCETINKYDTNANCTIPNNPPNTEIVQNTHNANNITSEDVKNMCKNISSSQSGAKPNRMSKILDKINSFNEKIESSHSNNTNKSIPSVLHVGKIVNKSNSNIDENRLKFTNKLLINNINVNTKTDFSTPVLPMTSFNSINHNQNNERIERITVESESMEENNGSSKNNITNISNDITNKSNNTDRLPNQNLKSVNDDDVESKISQSVKNKIKEFNSLRKNPIVDCNSNTVIVKKLNTSTLPNNRVTITKTVRKSSITYNNISPETNFNINQQTFNQLNTNNLINTLPKLKQPQPIKTRFSPTNINSDINQLSQSLDYSINLSNSQLKHVVPNKHQEEEELGKLNKTQVEPTNSNYDTNSLVKKRKQMFEVSNSKNNTSLKKNSTDEETPSIIKNRKSLFENFNVSLNHAGNYSQGYFNGSNACSNQGFYNGAARFMSNDQDEDSDESGYVESQELETLQQVNNNYVQV
ncbi:hypothetical protein M8J77_011934 [Diaphorina citri]|nr:hypothetical protein M8J77_011934 [Diaphorina citri]